MPAIMRFDVIILRLVFAAFLVSAGYVLHPIPGHRLYSTGGAALVALAIILFEIRIRRASLKTLIGAAVGSILGIIGAYLIGTLIASQESAAVLVRVRGAFFPPGRCPLKPCKRPGRG